jgi:hypothetical protein
MGILEVGGMVGPVAGQDGADPALRQGRDAELITADWLGRFSEATRRRKTFSGTTAIVGTTIVAGNNHPIAAAAASMISLYNPMGSGVDLHILQAILVAVSGTPGVGMIVWDVAYNQTITAVQNNNGTAGARPVCNYASGVAGAGLIFTQTALTGSGAQVLLRPYAGAFFGGAIAATTPNPYIDNVDGGIILPPGGLASIATPATGTTFVVGAGIEWMEIGAQTI